MRRAAQARGVEVRLVRRLPALAARLRGRAARARRRDRDRLLPRGRRAATVEGPYDLSLVEGSITTPRTPSGSGRSGASRGGWSRSAPARRRRHPGAAQLRRRRGLRVGRLRDARVHLDARDLDADRGHVPVDFELQGCPIDKRQLLEVISAFLNERRPAIAAHSVCIECKRARQRLRDGRPRHALPGPGDARRLRRALPVLPPRLLRLLRADGDAQHAVALRLARASLGMDEVDVVRVYRTFNAARRPFRDESERMSDG